MSDEPVPKQIAWPWLAVLGWLMHLVLAAGGFSRVLQIGPRYEQTYREYNLLLPWLTQQVLGFAGQRGPTSDLAPLVLGGLALFDLAMLAALAAHARPAWKWWFWGVVVVLLLGMLVVELALALPMWKLQEALSR